MERTIASIKLGIGERLTPKKIIVEMGLICVDPEDEKKVRTKLKNYVSSDIGSFLQIILNDVVNLFLVS